MSLASVRTTGSGKYDSAISLAAMRTTSGGKGDRGVSLAAMRTTSGGEGDRGISLAGALTMFLRARRYSCASSTSTRCLEYVRAECRACRERACRSVASVVARAISRATAAGSS
jgi:hypothetical protein